MLKTCRRLVKDLLKTWICPLYMHFNSVSQIGFQAPPIISRDSPSQMVYIYQEKQLHLFSFCPCLQPFP